MNTHPFMTEVRPRFLALLAVAACQSSTDQSQGQTAGPPQSESAPVAFSPGKVPANGVDALCSDAQAPLSTCNWAGAADLIVTAEILEQELRASPWNAGSGSTSSEAPCTGFNRAAFALRVHVVDVLLGSLTLSESADNLTVFLGAEGLSTWAPFPTSTDASGVTWSDGSLRGVGTSPLPAGMTVGLDLVRDAAGRLSMAHQLPYSFSAEGDVTFPEPGECSSLKVPEALQNASYGDFVTAIAGDT